MTDDLRRLARKSHADGASNFLPQLQVKRHFIDTFIILIGNMDLKHSYHVDLSLSKHAHSHLSPIAVLSIHQPIMPWTCFMEPFLLVPIPTSY